jgi:hypothetical protein
MSSDPAEPYRVVSSALVLQQFRQWGERARGAGLAEEYTACLRRIHERLSSDPDGWGNPLKNLAGLGMVLYHGADHWLYVQYGVNEAARIVFIEGARLMPNTPLAELP